MTSSKKQCNVQVTISTDLLTQLGPSRDYFELERRARVMGEEIAAHYNCTGKFVTVEVSTEKTGYGAGTMTEWFRVTYLNGKDKNVLRSKQGNFNDYAGMRRLWNLKESGKLVSALK